MKQFARLVLFLILSNTIIPLAHINALNSLILDPKINAPSAFQYPPKNDIIIKEGSISLHARWMGGLQWN